MIAQFVTNLIIAGVWMLLQETLSFKNFVYGYLIGLAVLHFTVGRLDSAPYTRRVLAAVKLMVVFVAEVVRCGVRVSYLLLHPRMPISPGLIAVPLDVKTNEAITLFAGMITMAPGSISVELSEDRSHLFVHALEAGDPHKAAAYLKRVLERRIMEVFE